MVDKLSVKLVSHKTQTDQAYKAAARRTVLHLVRVFVLEQLCQTATSGRHSVVVLFCLKPTKKRVGKQHYRALAHI